MDYREEIINSLVEVCKKARSEGFDSAREIYTKQVDSGYKKGLEDAWKCANKINDMNAREFEEVFGYTYYAGCMEIVSPSEAMQKIKEYEERQKDDEKSCGTCKHVMRIDCGAYPCNECPRDTLPKWEPKQDEKCEDCTKGISAECVVDGCEFEPEQTDATDIDDRSIKVGDEIYSDETDMTAVVHHIDAWGRYQCFNENGAQFVLDKETYDEYWHKTYKYYPQIAEVLEKVRE